MSRLVMSVSGSMDEISFELKRLIVAGWTGRNRGEVMRHIDELKGFGVRPPSTIPMFYEVSAGLVTQGGVVDDFDQKSSVTFHM